MIRPTEAEFEDLKRRRDEATQAAIEAMARQLGWDGTTPIHAHVSPGGNSAECYCACPDGPCQHEWTGPERAILDDRDQPCGFEVSCARCGMGAMAHSVRTGP